MEKDLEIKQIEYVGEGSLSKLREILVTNKSKKIFLVTGKDSYRNSGAEAAIAIHFKNYEIVRFFNFSSNTDIRDVEKGVALFKEHNADTTVAIGGGSVMDMAKSISIFSAKNYNLKEYITGDKKIEWKGKLLIAIPTTSGSGSEATHFAVIYIDKKKYSLAHENILPDFSIVEPKLTYSLPSSVTASSGIDALGQAIESYWSINSTKESKLYAKKAIELVLENLAKAVNTSSKSAKDNMSTAAHLAGKAINISKTTASHAMSYPITINFGIPHGHAVGLTLSRMLIYNSKITKDSTQDPRGIEYVDETLDEIYSLLGATSPESAQIIIDRLLKDTGLQTRLSLLGVNIDDVELMLDGFSEERAANNPRRFTKKDAKDILMDII